METGGIRTTGALKLLCWSFQAVRGGGAVMLYVPPPRAGAQQPGENRSCSCLKHCPGAAPSLSIPSAERAWKPSRRSRVLVGKLEQQKKKLVSKENTRSFLSLKDKLCFYIPDPYFQMFKSSAVAACPCPSHKQHVLSTCLAGAVLAPSQTVGIDAFGICDPH